MSLSNKTIANWYEVKEIAENVFWIREPKLVSFFLFRLGKEALLIDSGLGLSSSAAKELFAELNIEQYQVICTHAHCDHIGLNANATACGISKAEWDKYVEQNERTQLAKFLTILKDAKLAPTVLGENNIINTQEWKPTYYLDDGQEFKFGPWIFKVRQASGHTCGSLMFHEMTMNFLFSGDIIYDGKMYLHLKDSDFDQFRSSIDNLCDLQNKFSGLTIWPSHNSIPLPKDFPQKVKLAIQKHDRGEIPVAGRWPQDLIFEEGLIYNLDGVQFVQKVEKG